MLILTRGTRRKVGGKRHSETLKQSRGARLRDEALNLSSEVDVVESQPKHDTLSTPIVDTRLKLAISEGGHEADQLSSRSRISGTITGGIAARSIPVELIAFDPGVRVEAGAGVGRGLPLFSGHLGAIIIHHPIQRPLAREAGLRTHTFLVPAIASINQRPESHHHADIPGREPDTTTDLEKDFPIRGYPHPQTGHQEKTENLSAHSTTHHRTTGTDQANTEIEIATGTNPLCHLVRIQEGIQGVSTDLPGLPPGERRPVQAARTCNSLLHGQFSLSQVMAPKHLRSTEFRVLIQLTANLVLPMTIFPPMELTPENHIMLSGIQEPHVSIPNIRIIRLHSGPQLHHIMGLRILDLHSAMAEVAGILSRSNFKGHPGQSVLVMSMLVLTVLTVQMLIPHLISKGVIRHSKALMHNIIRTVSNRVRTVLLSTCSLVTKVSPFVADTLAIVATIIHTHQIVDSRDPEGHLRTTTDPLRPEGEGAISRIFNGLQAIVEAHGAGVTPTKAPLHIRCRTRHRCNLLLPPKQLMTIIRSDHRKTCE